LMKGDNKSEDLVAEKIAQDINQNFSSGYNIILNDTLNHFLVDFDITQILKNHIGYNSWSDVPMDQRDFATEAITKRIHFLTGILNKRVTEDLINQENTDHVLVVDLFNQNRY
jgi:hypothetical protein